MELEPALTGQEARKILKDCTSEPEVFIDYLRESDAKVTVELLNELLPLNYSTSYYHQIPSKHRLGAFIQVEGNRILVGLCLGYIISERNLNFEYGLTKNNLCSRLFSPKLFGYVSTIGVMPEFRRKGVCSRLLTKLEYSFNRFYSIIGVYLHVQEANTAAVRMYESKGYSVKMTKPNYYSLDPTGADALVMCKEVKPSYSEQELECLV